MKIDIIGKGNVGTHLSLAFGNKADVVTVNSRTLDELRSDSDIYLISVSDNAILNVAKSLRCKINNKGILAHTSGTTPASILKGCAKSTGVFYPLQTFSKDVSLDYSEIPFFIEGNDHEVEQKLVDAAKLISNKITIADSEKRRDIHIASVFCCNFVNHLWALSDEYLKEHGLDFNIMLPLITETVRKAKKKAPYSGQTGPAVRHDNKTLESHMQRLETKSEMQEIYSLLSLSIMSHHPLEVSKTKSRK